MRACVAHLLLACSLSVLAVGCGDDGPGTVTVGDEYDGGKTDSGRGPEDTADSGAIIFGGCDASDPKCMTDAGPNTHNNGAGSGGDGDDGGLGDAG